MARTFKVAEKDYRGRPLTPPPGPRRSTNEVRRAMDVQLRGKTVSEDSAYVRNLPKKKRPMAIEAGGANASTLVEGWVPNAMVGAIHASFDDHVPLVLSPDDIWLTIAQGFAFHVDADPEALRKHFVQHEGKKLIDVRRDHFVKGADTNHWPGVFAEFSDKIAENIGVKKRDLIVSRFSTTGPIELVASEVTLMDSMKNFFDYRVSTCCGIPEITLLGTVQDWKDVRARTQALGEYGLDWWTKHLLPVLDQFVDASEGKVDRSFWTSIYREGGGSGGPYVTGWVQIFFPYEENWADNGRYTRRNSRLERWDLKNMRHGMCDGPTFDGLPSGISKAPFEWHYFAEVFPMEFVAGFVGYTQDPTSLAVRPAIGWGVRDAYREDVPKPVETVDRSFACYKCGTTLHAKPPKDEGEVRVDCACGQRHYCTAREVSITA